jgi:hypothetical protein
MINCLFLVIPVRLERTTHSLEGCCSIQLSYGTNISKFYKTSNRTDPSRVRGIALSNPEKQKSPISSFFEDPRFDDEVIMTSFKSGLSYGTNISKFYKTLNRTPDPSRVRGIALSNPEKQKSPISSFFEDPRFDDEVIMTSFKSGLSYGTYIIKTL